MTQMESSTDLNYTYKTVPISKVKELLAAGYDVDVDAPGGFTHVVRYVEKGLKRMFTVYCNNKRIRISYDHLFETNLGWVFAANLDPNKHTILCDDGKYHQFEIEYIEEGEDTVDLEVSHPEHKYYTNGLCSHNTNIGKTLIMTSLATNFVMCGQNVLYVTFEDPENKIASRIAQNMFDITQQQYRQMSRDDFVKAFTKAKSKLNGNRLIIKEFPEYSTNALKIRSLIKELKEKQDFVPDVLFIDYIGCMVPNGRYNPNMNSNTLLLTVAMQVRALGMELGIPVISSSQANRGGNGVAEIALTDVADSFGQNMKADAVFGITQTEEMKEQGLYTVKLLKTRYGAPLNNRPTLTHIGVNTEKQRIFDIDLMNSQQQAANIFTKANTDAAKHAQPKIDEECRIFKDDDNAMPFDEIEYV